MIGSGMGAQPRWVPGDPVSSGTERTRKENESGCGWDWVLGTRLVRTVNPEKEQAERYRER